MRLPSFLSAGYSGRLPQSTQKWRFRFWSNEPSAIEQPDLSARDRIIDMAPLLKESSCEGQMQSRFFSALPAEIRCQIYSYVLPPGRRLWVRPADIGMVDNPEEEIFEAHSQGAEQHPSALRFLDHFPYETAPEDDYYVSRLRGCGYTGFHLQMRLRRIRPHQDSLALMKTCQRM